MGEPPKRRATYTDVLQAPANSVAELIDGELQVLPRPAVPHAAAASVLGETLMPPFHRGRGGPGGWLILHDPELHFGEDVLVPDLAGWRRERMPQAPRDAAIRLAPDWVCEILSPRTERWDRARKLPVYAREAVTHVWLVDPAEHLLEVLRREGSQWLTLAVHEGDNLVRAEPFEALEFPLAYLWADVVPEKD